MKNDLDKSTETLSSAHQFISDKFGPDHPTSLLLSSHIKDTQDPEKVELENPELMFDDAIQGFQYAIATTESQVHFLLSRVQTFWNI